MQKCTHQLIVDQDGEAVVASIQALVGHERVGDGRLLTRADDGIQRHARELSVCLRRGEKSAGQLVGIGGGCSIRGGGKKGGET